jgi:hypothetical protein
MPRTTLVSLGGSRARRSLAVALLLGGLALPSSAQTPTRERRNFHGMHNLMDGGAAVPEGMNWTRHLVGEGGYVFDWVRGDYGKWVVEAMDRGLIPCLRLQDCNGGCNPDPGYPENVATIIREHLERYRPQYVNRLVYLQLWNEPGDARDRVSEEQFADFLVAAHAGVKRADLHGVFRTMTPGQNGPDWWRKAIRHNPAVCQAFDVWATHPYPESYPPHYNHHDGVPFINQVKTIDSYLLDLDAVADECERQGSPRRGFPVMITETAYGDHLGIAYEGYPKTTRGPACSTDGPCEDDLASRYNVAAFADFWRRWPEILAVHPFILNNRAWEAFAFVARDSGSRADQPRPAWCPPQDAAAGIAWPPGYSQGAQRCGLPTAPYPQYKALLDLPKPPPASLEPYRGSVGTLRGFVRRADTGEPVKYATVFTDGREFGGPTLFDGQYVVRSVPVGTYTLSAEKVGYGGASASVTVTEGAEAVVDLDLPYRGKVSKGIYFRNQGTCSSCNLFASFLGQTFTVSADVGFVKFVAAMPNVGNVTLRFSILEGGPTGPPVGTPTTAFLEWGGEMIGAEFPGDGVPVEPGGVYFLKVERADGAGVYLYATDANPYPGGMAFTGTTPHPGWDLFATIRGRTVAVDTAVGSLAGAVEDASGQPLAGARITVEPGGHVTTTADDGGYLLAALAEGLYQVTASLDGYPPQTRTGVDVFRGQTTRVDLVLERDLSYGQLEGQVRDETGAPIEGATLRTTPGDQAATSDVTGHYVFDRLPPASYTVAAARDGFAGREASVVVDGGATARLDFVLTALPPPPPPASLIVNGDFAQGLTGWTPWRERGTLNPTVDSSGRLRLAAVGHNGGVYQRFSTGGAGRTITVGGFWASDPTRSQSQWAEVLVINGPATPVDGQDLTNARPDVVLVFKNDTWASPGGWSGPMDQTAPVAAAGAFVAAGDVATIVLKSGNLPGVDSGTLFDDVVVRGPGAPPPPVNRPPTAQATAAPQSGTAPLAVAFDGSGSSDPDGDALTYVWDFGDGTTDAGVSVSHTFASAGSFAVRLTVDDGRGGSDAASLVVTATSPGPPPPVAPGSKLSIHTGFGGPLSMAFVQRAKPKVLKILDSFSGAAEVKRLSPDTEIIGRAYLASQPMDGDPVERAREWWDRMRNLVVQNPDVDYWEGYNEPVIQTVELMDWYARFEAERVRLLASVGRKACIGSFSVGNPDLPLWPAFFPAIDAALAHGGILGLHEYGTPMQQYFDATAGEGWLCGRYRKVYRQYLLATGRPIRLAITECGVDVVPPVGWKNHFTEEEYLDQLKWYDRVLREDDYVIGATIFALEIPGWWSFDIAPIVDRLGDYVAAEAATP